MGGAVAGTRKGKVYKWFWWGKLEGQRSLRIPRHRWEDNMMDLQELEREGMDWIEQTQNRDRWRVFVNR